MAAKKVYSKQNQMVELPEKITILETVNERENEQLNCASQEEMVLVSKSYCTSIVYRN